MSLPPAAAMSPSAAWERARAHKFAPRPSLRAMLDAGHVDQLALPGMLIELSRLGLEAATVAVLAELAAECGVAQFLERVAAGDTVNPSEGRAATHMALRDPATRAVHGGHAALEAETRRLRTSGLRHILHIGIGGSALGPALLLDALGTTGDGPEVRVVANIDGEALARAIQDLDPHRTGIIAVSKTFTTSETLRNLESACQWLLDAKVRQPMARVTAVTAAPDRAIAAGVSPAQVLVFPESVGGRYSLWSAVGLPFAVRCGWPAFMRLLDGAHTMDRHVREAPFMTNAALRLAAADLWFSHLLGRPTRAVFAYDVRLTLLPAWLQQLEMESNGKGVTADGREVPGPTAPILWGGTGTDAQHAVFQLLHQGTHADPVEFVAVATPGHGLAAAHHEALLANCLAQGAALAIGRPNAPDPQRRFPGNRPSMTILLDRLTPERLGALLALFEARTIAFAAMLGLNPFDQWGVELGKEMAAEITSGTRAPDPVTATLQAFLSNARNSAS
ncbi:glucose-6-phosphate isomerase [Thermaurantiacus sp.]